MAPDDDRPDESELQRRLTFWERAILESARICGLCFCRRYIWHDGTGRVWVMCVLCDVAPARRIPGGLA